MVPLGTTPPAPTWGISPSGSSVLDHQQIPRTEKTPALSSVELVPKKSDIENKSVNTDQKGFWGSSSGGYSSHRLRSWNGWAGGPLACSGLTQGEAALGQHLPVGFSCFLTIMCQVPTLFTGLEGEWKKSYYAFHAFRAKSTSTELQFWSSFCWQLCFQAAPQLQPPSARCCSLGCSFRNALKWTGQKIKDWDLKVTTTSSSSFFFVRWTPGGG